MKNAMLLAIAAALICTQAPGTADAADVSASLEAGIGHSDNIARSNTATTNQTLGSLGAAFDMKNDQGPLTGTFAGNLDYVYYTDNAFPDALYGRVDLNSRYAIVQDSFSWVLQDSWGQNRRNDFLTANPGNLENVNYLSTGPDLRFRFGSRTYLTLGGRYGVTSYQKTPRDYTSLGGAVGLKHDVSPVSTVGINAHAYHIDYTNSAFASNYDGQEATVSYEAKGARTRLSAEAGGSQVKSHGTTHSSPVVRLTVTRDVASASHVTLQGGQEFTDAGRVFQGGNFVPGQSGYGNPTNAVQAGDAIKKTYASASWKTAKPRTNWGLGFSYRREQHEVLTEYDRKVYSYYVQASHHLTTQLVAGATVSYIKEKFDTGVLDDDRIWGDLNAQWSFTPKSFARIEWRYHDSTSNSALRQYTENQYWLRFGYQLR